MPTETTAFTGKGGSLSLSIDGLTFTRIAQIQKISSSSQKASLADITNLDSPNSYVERLPTTLDSGTLSGTVISNPSDSGQLLLLSSFQAQAKLTGKLQYPPVGTQVTGLVKTFSCYVTSAPIPSLAVTEASTFDFELTITGGVTDVPGA